MPPRASPVGPSLVRVGAVLIVAVVLVAGAAGYWQVVAGPGLAASADNPGVIAAQRNVVRGLIEDRDGRVLASSRRDENGEPYRVYAGPEVAPVVGYASRVFGTAGLERSYDAELTGDVGTDPLLDLLRKFDPQGPRTKDITISISLRLQRLAVRELGSRKGAVVMLDPRTGEILALASTPTFDPSLVTDPATSRQAYQRLLDDPDLPLLNRATIGLYVPGSVFKIVTAIAGLGSGAITPATTYAQQPAAEANGLVVDGFQIRDGHHPFTGDRALDLVGATEVSCNIYYALTGLELGGERLVDWAARLGFGAAIPFDLPTSPSQVTNGNGSAPGGFADDVELANAAYGQAETLVTPLQMALVAATIANDGVMMKPHLVTALTAGDGSVQRPAPEKWREVLSAEDAQAIGQAMLAAVEGEYGRLFTAGAAVPGVPTAGKSGTAQLGGSGEPHSWFIGYAPADDPQVAIAVLVEQGGSGASRAAPMAGRLLAAFLQGGTE